MADLNNERNATIAYESLCAMLDAEGWKYDRYDDDLTIALTMVGEDLPMGATIEIDAERQVAIMLSPMPFAVAENRRAEMAIAVSIANYGLVDGSFDYNFLDGKITFRMTSNFMDSMIGKELFKYMTYTAFSTIDHYNDKFLMVAKSQMDIKEIIEFLKD